jgi:hypothetical protein
VAKAADAEEAVSISKRIIALMNSDLPKPLVDLHAVGRHC